MQEELDQQREGNLFKIIQNMNVMQKVKLARMGNKDARGLLVRDRNKIVATAAIRSPKITGNEVESLSRSRNLSEEVLRIIAANRDWTKSYRVKLGLATNPKVRIPTAMKFLNYLQERLPRLFEFATVYTMVAGLLNVLAIYDAWGGPVFYAKSDEDEDDSKDDDRRKHIRKRGYSYVQQDS